MGATEAIFEQVLIVPRFLRICDLRSAWREVNDLWRTVESEHNCVRGRLGNSMSSGCSAKVCSDGRMQRVESQCIAMDQHGVCRSQAWTGNAAHHHSRRDMSDGRIRVESGEIASVVGGSSSDIP